MGVSDLLLGIIIGIAIGWNVLPQPKWIRNLWLKLFNKED